MTAFTISVQNQAVQSGLDALARRLGDMAPVLDDIGAGIVQRTKARFDTSAGPDGQAWKPKKQPDGNKPLIGPSGDLRRQIVPTASGNTLLVQATAKYAAIHQFGGKIERPAYSMQVRHRTNAKGELLRSAIMSGKGLVFAKKSDELVRTRWFEVAAHSINIPARPFLPVRQDGSLYPTELAAILAQIEVYLAEGAGSV